ncbi:MAG: DUF3107 domain-containing protein [Acidimicrobiia bacterium]|nr:DUF3107 domain-containing protein [Acidimicrobiia bacterium]
MEVRIGVIYSPKELTVEIDGSPEHVVALVEKAMAEGSPILWIEDVKERRVGVPVDKIAYIEVAADDESRRVGFGR